MPPNQTDDTMTMEITTSCNNHHKLDDSQIAERPTIVTQTEVDSEYVPKIIWLNVIAISLFHIIGFLMFPFAVFKMKIMTTLWSK